MTNIASWFYSSPPTNLTELQELKFYIHDKEHIVKVEDAPPQTTLNTYLREQAHLTGTKNMCMEGGCGSCVVAVSVTDPVTNRDMVLAVNSCLIPIYSCSGWKIHTSEAIGDPKTGFHPVQKALVQFNGTQCGFCSSGMVMNMYALYETGKFTMKDVDNSFGGNICRCTGYRSILSAFKSLATDATPDMIGKFADIEDIPVCKRTQGKCRMNCPSPCNRAHFYNLRQSRWFRVFSINEVLDVIRDSPDADIMLVGGNTATGVYKRHKEPEVYIDITCVKDLLTYSISGDNLILGANMTLTNAMILFYKLANENPKFSYLKKLADHIDLIANVPVRNTGTLSGNLSIKHEHHEFPSDIFLILETAGATMTITGTDHQDIVKSLSDYLTFDMKGKIIKNIILPTYDESYKYESYKIMPRAQNAHALVNAGFLFKLDGNGKVGSARIVYGCINPSFIHAKNAENFVVGKNLYENDTLQGLFQQLDKELEPDHVLPDPAPEFRKQLAISLCYKFILSITPDDKLTPRKKSGGSKLIRPVSSGVQDYDTNEAMYPVTKAIPKIEALAQCTGQAEYIMDIPDRPGQLFAAFVLAKAPPSSVISKIDPSEALKLDGVVAFYGKDDIPGENNFMPKAATPMNNVIEEIFCSGIVKYYFQPVGITVAESQELAEKAADLVQISFVESKTKPLLTIRDVLAAKVPEKIFPEGKMEASSKGTDIKHVIKGQMDIYWQYHYTMETQCCAVVPVEDGFDLYPATQTMNYAQTSAAKVLNIPLNKINVTVRRIGGGYGSKISRNSLVSCAAALASYKTKKPVKLFMPLMTNMNVIGKRFPFSCYYEVGVNDKGAIQYMNTSNYSDYGSCGGNEALAKELMFVFTNTYKHDTWNVEAYSTRTDTQTGTACRAPFTTEGTSAIENIMEHIASDLKLDPIEVRLENLDKNTSGVPKYINDLIEWADVEKRRKDVAEFNKANRWVKKGISVVPMVYPFGLFGNWHVVVSIYQGDGSVAVVHGGIEMGQGINTKAAQVCAYALGIPLDQVSIKPSNVLISPNAFCTGGSLTSEAICYGILKACDELKEKMKPVKEKMKNASWPELVRQSYIENINLSSTYMFQAKLPDFQNYPIFGATCVEVEVDILTGLHQITRVDILEDTGESLSPQVDLGQIEGAFIMGLGYWTSEQIIYSPEGELLTNRTWTYKPPGAKDIPIDFRVKFPKKNPNSVGVLNSKATAEPPLVMTCSVPFAIRNAVGSARAEANSTAEIWYPIDGPATVEYTFMNSLHDYKQYTL